MKRGDMKKRKIELRVDARVRSLKEYRLAVTEFDWPSFWVCEKITKKIFGPLKVGDYIVFTKWKVVRKKRKS